MSRPRWGGDFPLRSDQYVVQATMEDLIRVLQLLCGLNPEGIEILADLNGDGRVGLAEAIGILKEISEPGYAMD